MKNFPNSFQNRLLDREKSDSLRSLPKPNKLIDFSSNDYLGLAKSKDLFEEVHQFLIEHKQFQNGATGSRLLTGNFELNKQVEDDVKNFHNAQAALVFNSGYDANLGFFGSIANRNSVIFYDQLIHASIRDGIRLSNAQSFKFLHNDLDDLKEKLEKYASQNSEIFVVTESVFSMDGDRPDLVTLTALCQKHKAFLIVDEAHSLGVFGNQGEGLIQELGLENQVFARVITFGKALGVHGAAILGSDALKSYLINFSRSFIYSTALSPHSLASILIGYKHLKNANNQRKLLHQNIQVFNALFEIEHHSPIKSIVFSGNESVKLKAMLLQNSGFDVKPILSPTVAEGQERLRFCLHAYNTEDEIKSVYSGLYK